LMLMHQVAAKAFRDATFLTAWPATALPLMTIATAAVTVVLVQLFSRLLLRFPAALVVSAVLGVSALLHGVEDLLRAGLYRDYKLHEERLRFVRGRILLDDQLRQGGLLHRQSCRYADLTADTPENRVVAATLRYLPVLLGSSAEVEQALRRKARSLLLRFGDEAVADAFVASRLAGDWGHAFGTLPGGTDFGRIIDRHRATS